jgi:thioredoxin 2
MSTIDRSGVVVSCAQCGKSNRLPYGALGKATRCGHCKAAISPADTPIEAQDAAAFDAAIAASAIPVLVDFWAPWCGPCKMVAPELERVARSNAGRYLVLKVNTDVHQEIGGRFRIRSIPTLALLAGGREVERIAGARPASDIEAFAAQALEKIHRRAS